MIAQWRKKIIILKIAICDGSHHQRNLLCIAGDFDVV